MPGVLYNENNVAVGQAALYYKTWTPSLVLTQIADATVPLSTAGVTAWEAAGWTVAGATDEGFKINAEASTTTLTIEEQATPVGEQMESKNIGVEAALAEDTLESMSLAWGGGTITTVAGPPAKRTMSLVDTVKYLQIALELKNTLGFARRIYVPKVSCYGSGETSFRRAAAKRLYPVKMTSLCKPSDIIIVDFTS